MSLGFGHCLNFRIRPRASDKEIVLSRCAADRYLRLASSVRACVCVERKHESCAFDLASLANSFNWSREEFIKTKLGRYPHDKGT